MVTKTFGWHGVALPLLDENERVPWRVRIPYMWKVFRGRIRIVGIIDISHVEEDHYMEGRIRVAMTNGEVKRYLSA